MKYYIIFFVLLILGLYISENSVIAQGKPSKQKQKKQKKSDIGGSAGESDSYDSDVKRGDGSYGQREKEKKYLNKRFKTNINGNTHEAEHAIGYKVLVQNLDDQLGVSRDSWVGRLIENSAPAYMEVKELHRNHVGTGSKKEAKEYRKAQDNAIESGKLVNAIQLNQLEYAQDAKFKQIAKTSQGKVATDSFNNMIVKNPEFVQGYDGVEFRDLKLDRGGQIESILTRKLAIEGRNTYTQDDINEAKKLFEKDDKKQAKDFFKSIGA